MGRKFFKLVLPLFFITTISFSQSQDSLVVAEGQILNAATKEPVMARITYQSLPYGNKVGVLNNNAYSFPMFDGEKYSIIVEAPGFSVAKYMLDPAEARGSKKVIKNIELTTGAPVAPEVGKVIRLDNLIFQVGKARISPESHSELEAVLDMMRENKKMVIQLEGHTDYQGDPKENLKLSQMRVDAVKSYLVSKDVSKQRIKTKAFGGTMPLSRDNTPEAHRLNRRVELRILEN
ncbi:OmpA family protein [Chryseolinea lacunae]|uniref:OmpA family protein n=1 Tax=Chryseolinea lacunae TaxID=2801331 RepID=A0ABS1KRG4_9BACT|nr:OmpA family protein [Chryseolinea lacunae]MBL0741949.1 OmpA family protein [Chryseolinea lacunae]